MGDNLVEMRNRERVIEKFRDGFWCEKQCVVSESAAKLFSPEIETPGKSCQSKNYEFG